MSQSTPYQLDWPSGKDEEIQLTFFLICSVLLYTCMVTAGY